MKVLITGASGRLAGYVARELADRYELVLTSRRRPPEDMARFPWIEGDLPSFDDCRRMVDGVAAVQFLEKYGTELYLQYRIYSLDRDIEPSVYDMKVGTIGARIKF